MVYQYKSLGSCSLYGHFLKMIESNQNKVFSMPFGLLFLSFLICYTGLILYWAILHDNCFFDQVTWFCLMVTFEKSPDFFSKIIFGRYNWNNFREILVVCNGFKLKTILRRDFFQFEKNCVQTEQKSNSTKNSLQFCCIDIVDPTFGRRLAFQRLDIMKNCN